MPPLVKPALANVSAGQPITAQAWNAILSAIGALYDAVLAIGGNAVDIELRQGATPITSAQVVAVPASGAPVTAVPPRGGGTAFTLTGLTAGAWTVYVHAPGFQPSSTPVAIPATTQTINLTPATTAMPDLLGTTASSAISTLATAGVQLDLVLDVTGQEISKTTLPASKTTSRVLFQFPLPGTQVVAATAHVRIVLSADMEDAIAVVPNFVGLTYAQLVQAINAAGLKLGKVTYANV